MFKNSKQHSNCNDYILDLLEYVETYLLRVDTVKRARINDIVATFENFYENCRRTSKYCTSRTREARDGPGLSEIIEFPEQQDEVSDSASPGRAPSRTQSPWQTREDSASDQDKTPTDSEPVADTPAGLGISHDDTQDPRVDPGVEVSLDNDHPNGMNGQPKENETSEPTVKTTSMNTVSNKQSQPNPGMVLLSSHQNQNQQYGLNQVSSAQPAVKRELHNVEPHSPAKPAGGRDSGDHAASAATRGLPVEDKAGRKRASSAPKKLRKRVRRRLEKVLDFFLGS